MQIIVTKRSQVQGVVKKMGGKQILLVFFFFLIGKSCWFFVCQEHNILNNAIARKLWLFCFLFVQDRVAMPRTVAKLVANWMGTLEVATFGRPFLCLRGFTLELLK